MCLFVVLCYVVVSVWGFTDPIHAGVFNAVGMRDGGEREAEGLEVEWPGDPVPHRAKEAGFETAERTQRLLLRCLCRGGRRVLRFVGFFIFSFPSL